LTNAFASLAASCLKRRVVVAADSPGTGASFMLNLIDDFLAPSAQVNSRFINPIYRPFFVRFGCWLVLPPYQLDDVFRRQDRADKIRLRRGVNFVQMTLPFAQLHKLLDALV
jgi:hypothetical protein